MTSNLAEKTSEKILHLFCFGIEGQGYALPLDDVIKVLPAVAVSPLPDSPGVIMGIVNVRGRILPVADIRKRLGLPRREMRLEDRLLWVKAAGQEILIVADNVQGVCEFFGQDVVPVTRLPEATPLLKGIARLPRGVVLIQDLAQLLDFAEREALEDALARL